MKKKVKKKKEKEPVGLRRTFLNYFILSFIVFPLIVGIIVFFTSFNFIRTSFEKDFYYNAQIKKIAAEEWLRRVKDVARQVSSRTKIREELEKYNKGEIGEEELKRFTYQKLIDALLSSKGILEILRFDARGNFILSVGKIKTILGKDKIKSFFVKKTIDKPQLFDTKEFLIVRSPILNRKNRYIGSDLVILGLSELKRILEISAYPEGKNLVFLLNKKNEIIFSNMNLIKNKEFLKTNKIAQFISKFQKKNVFHFKEYIVSYTNVDEGVNWKLIFLKNKSEVYKYIVSHLLDKTIFPITAIFVLIVIFLFFTFPFANSIILKTDEFEDIIEKSSKELKAEIQCRKELEKELRETLLLKNAILESSNGIVVFALDREYRYLDFTLLHKQTMKAIWGVDIEKGKSMLDYIKNEKDRKKAKKNFDRALAGESFVLIEEYGDEKLKRTFYEDRYSPVYNDDGEIIGVSVFVIDITKQKLIETALRESEEYNKVLFQDSLIPLVVMDSKTYEFTDCNRAAIKIYGFKNKEEVLGKTPADVSTPYQYNGEPSEKLATKFIQKALKEGKVIFEWRHQRPDGSIWDAEVQLITFFYKGKRHLQFSLLDITERKKLREKLIESEEKYRIAFRTSPESIAITSLGGMIIDVNDGFTKLSGYSKEEAIGKTVFDLKLWLNKEDRAYFIKELEEKGHIENFESKFLTKNKKVATGLVSANIVKIGGEKRILTIIRDITDRKRMEEEVFNEREMLSVTLRSIGDGVITTDTRGKVTFINKTAEELTGWTLDEVEGKPLEKVFNIINGVTREKAENPVFKVLKEKRIVGLENRTVLISREGKEYNIADSAAPIVDVESKVIGVVLVFRDVTEKLKLEQERLKVKKLESIGILAGGIAHDFNNILTGIFGNLELAKIKLSKDHPAYKHIKSANESIERATALTKQLLTFAKGGEPIVETVDLKKLLKDTISFYLSGSNIKVIYGLPDDLWNVLVDKGQIEQVISNLIVNSKQAMPDGGRIFVNAQNIESMETLEIRHLNGRYVMFSIKDEGRGISEKHMEKIFDPYFTTKQKGSGLGLAIVHSIVSKHNGYIAVDSKLGEGTTFYIYLPAAGKSDEGGKKIGESKSRRIFSSIKVLVVDDEKVVRDVAISMLESLGCKAYGVPEGRKALKEYKRTFETKDKYDIVIMDLTIPGGMGGKELIKKIKRIDPEVKAIVASGYSNDPIMSNYKKYGFSGKLLKPFQIEDLEKEILRVLEESSYS